MGGAADLPQRSSSPLKRRASSELDNEAAAGQKEDIDMQSPQPPIQPEECSSQDTSMEDGQKDEALDVPDNQQVIRESSTGTMDHEEEIGRSDAPPIDEQIHIVKQMLDEFDNTTLQEGQKVYIVSNKWLARVQARGSGAKVIEEDTESEIGPVDNTDIIQETLTDQDGLQFVRLKPGLSLQEYTQFPRPAWDMVVGWYGLQPRQIAIERTVINTSLDPNGVPQTIIEMNPIVITVHRLWGSHSPLPIPSILKSRDPLAPVFIVSQTDRFMNLLKRIKTAAGIDLPQIVRLWRVSRIVDGMDITSAPVSRANTPAPDAKSKEETWARLLVDVKSFLDLERGVQRELLDVKDQTNNKNFNGSSTVGMIFGGADNDLVLDELLEGGSYLTDYVAPKNTKNLALTTVNRASASKADSGRNSPSLLGPVTRGRSQKSGKPLGAVGLVNLGNSCYMNSALQCIRNCEELTKFFLSGEAEKELNTTNHLGSYGAVAIAYHNLLREFYKDPTPSAYAPRGFKNAMSKYDPTYSNYSQQDSQEFLGSFLSCLQEDLGRIETKPYIEKPDSTDEIVASEDSIKKFAAQIWENHKKRDDSAITDLFTGMYKSTLVCPVCAKVSVTFDPFTTLSIPLAIENTWTHDVFYFPLNDYPTRISIDIDKQGTIRTMKEFISGRVGVPPENLFVAEEWKNRFFKFFEDSKLVAEEIQSSDHIAVYELEAPPTNWPATKKKTKKFKSSLNFSSYNNDSEEDEIPGWDDPMAERMVVPVYHRQPNVSTGYGRAKPWVFAPVPHFVVLTPAEARNEDIIRRKVLEKVKTFTTYELDGDNDIEGSNDDEDQGNVDGDIVLTTASDADSSGDGKVVATSVDGEDDVVDVTMKDSTNIRESVEVDSNVDHKRSVNKLKRKYNSRRPTWMDPKVFLPGEFQGIFNLSYFSGKELVPVGWNSVNEDTTYTPLSARDPRLREAAEEEEENSVDGEAEKLKENDDISDEDEDDIPSSAVTRMNDEDSDEDPIPVSTALPDRTQRSGVRIGPGTTRKKMITYSRRKRTSRLGGFDGTDERELDADIDDGPLVRLGEGIVVDWNPEAHAELFDGQEGDPDRGVPTYTQIELMDDPILEAKRKSQASRKRNGISLQECLDEYAKEEILSENDTWKCPRCEKMRRASKKLEIWKTPDILIMHLKRFRVNGMRREKIDINVDFPIENFDLSSRVLDTPDGKQEIFDLFAVDNHYGSLGGGHYTAFAKSFIDGEWYEYNDSICHKTTDIQRMVAPAAYLLFYRRRSSVPLGGPHFQEIIERFDNQSSNADEDSAGSGEDQRLGADSSHRGSSSALTGVGATRPLGPGSVGGIPMTRNPLNKGALLSRATVNPADIDAPPDYREAITEDDGAPLLQGDAEMNDGIEMDGGLDDEAIDLGPYNDFSANRNTTFSPSNAAVLGTWTFQNLETYTSAMNPLTHNSETANDIDADERSDVVQHNSSASEGSIEARLQEFNDADVEGGDWEDPSPVPDIDEEAQMRIIDLHKDFLESGNSFGAGGFANSAVFARVGVSDAQGSDEGDDEDAAEIHVDEDEGVN